MPRPGNRRPRRCDNPVPWSGRRPLVDRPHRIYVEWNADDAPPRIFRSEADIKDALEREDRVDLILTSYVRHETERFLLERQPRITTAEYDPYCEEQHPDAPDAPTVADPTADDLAESTEEDDRPPVKRRRPLGDWNDNEPDEEEED